MRMTSSLNRVETENSVLSDAHRSIKDLKSTQHKLCKESILQYRWKIVFLDDTSPILHQAPVFAKQKG